MAEDLLSDTFLKLWENREKVDAYQKNFMYYFTQIAHNVCRNHLKKTSLEKVVYLNENELESQQIISIDATPTPEILTSIQDILDEESYDILILHYVHGFKYREISQLKNIPVSTLTSLASRAIKKVQRKFKL